MKVMYKLRKYMAFFLLSVIPAITLVSLFLFKVPQIITFGAFFLVIIIMFVVASFALKNPFTDYLEGKGMIAIDMTSTGILRFFNVKIFPPKIEGKIGNNVIEDIWDRNVTTYMVPPSKNQGYAVQDKEGHWHIKVKNDEYQKAKLMADQFPVVLYNTQNNTLITKDFLNNVENNTFANHSILKLNYSVSDLNNHLRNFGRYVVDQLKPKESFLQTKVGKIAIVIVIIVLIVFLVIAAPTIIGSFKDSFGAVSGAGSGIQEAVKTLTPK